MAGVNIYVDKDGNEIRATEKAYRLFYKTNGFVLKDAKPDKKEKAVRGRSYEDWTVSGLQNALKEAGMKYDACAKKKELFDLLSEADTFEKET